VHAQVETRQEDVGGESHHRDVEVGVEHAESLCVRALGRPIEVILLELNVLLGFLELQEREENEKQLLQDVAGLHFEVLFERTLKSPGGPAVYILVY
jgi:hypothetical protein